MKSLTKLALASCLLATACAPAGYYDSNGVYRSYGKSDSYRHEHAIAGAPEEHYYEPAPASATTIVYTRPGYYDYNGYYISEENGPRVPEEYLPPHGLCRVWLSDRRPSEQPRIESCKGIQSRVPAGAYVIYGG